MPQLDFVTLDVFGNSTSLKICTIYDLSLTFVVTKTKFKGNPLALVFIPADQDPPTQTLQTIAREFNLSETAFLYLNSNEVVGSNGKTATTTTTTTTAVPEWRARIFMIDAELPFAGHPTIGTACHALGSLAHGAAKGRLHIPAGAVEAEFSRAGVAKAAIPHNVHVHSENPFSITDVQALQPKLQGRKVLGVDVVSPVKGMNFVCVELRDLETLRVVECTGKRPAAKLDGEWDVGFVGALFYVKTGEEEGGKRVKLRTRMIEGVMEDPATGSASCALSAFLSLKSRERLVDYELTQGVEMGRQSDIGISVRLNEALDAVERLEMSGSSVKVMEGKVEYE